MKKALSLFLVALLVFSFSVFPAYAADGDEDPLTAINNIIALWDDPYGSVFPTIVADQGYYCFDWLNSQEFKDVWTVGSGNTGSAEFRSALNSVYTRSGQNGTPNSNATNLHSSQKRCCSFCISSSNASPTFQVQKSIFHQMTKPIQVTVILPLLLAISFSRNDDIHSSISGISNDLIGVIPTIGQ